MRSYKIAYLPQFSEDLNRTAVYISNVLHNPQAAYNLIDEIEKAILERSYNPEGFEKYPSKKKRLHDYYRIYVKEYVVYYVVLDTPEGKIMEIRRLLHSRQNREQIL